VYVACVGAVRHLHNFALNTRREETTRGLAIAEKGERKMKYEGVVCEGVG
jgi:hypothetical protein